MAQIITLGIVVDVNDPRGFGRIRARDITETDSTRANAVPWETRWSKDDPFVYSPFLPSHINIVPKVQQSVKLVRYDTRKDLQNQEYVPGPYTTPHDFGDQDSESQISETTFGARSVKTPAIKSFAGNKKVYDDNFIRAESVGSLPRVSDIALSGNYGSDIILTEHGVNIRAGKFIDRFIDNIKQKQELKYYPTYSRKNARLSLKKYPETFKLISTEITDSVVTRTDLKHLLEYDLDSISNPTQITINLYRINNPEGEKYKTDVFNIDSELGAQTSELVYTEVTVLQDTGNKLQEAYVLIREFISKLDREKLSIIDSTLPIDSYAHPFYYRPVPSLRSQAGANSFLENVVFLTRANGFGLVFSQDNLEPPIKEEKRIVSDLKKISDVDQTFAAITSDFVLQLSTQNPGVDGKKIDFSSLDRYEYSQEDYLKRIIPNTYSSVRGEKLVELLDIMAKMLINHTHGILTPPYYWPEQIARINEIIANAKTGMLNTSIRIN
jgi:hypothetical protein